jgi:hypothetical protein
VPKTTQLRTHQVLVRLSDTEYAYLETRRRAGGHRSIAAFLMALGLADVDPDEQVVGRLTVADRKALVASAGRAGESLTELARLARGGLGSSLDPARLELAIAEIGAVHQLLARAISGRQRTP